MEIAFIGISTYAADVKFVLFMVYKKSGIMSKSNSWHCLRVPTLMQVHSYHYYYKWGILETDFKFLSWLVLRANYLFEGKDTWW